MPFDRRLLDLLHRRAGELGPLDRALLGWARFGSIGAVALMALVGARGGAAGRQAVVRCLVSGAVISPVCERVGGRGARPRPSAVDGAASPLIEHARERWFPSRHGASATAMAVTTQPANGPAATIM